MSHTAFVITVSDSSFRGEREDRSGPAVAKFLSEHAFSVQGAMTVPDEEEQIKQALLKGCETADLVITTGGTGIAARDVTPEATRAVCEKVVEGVAEKMRSEGLKHTPLAPLSRGMCGTRGQTVILNVPGSPKGAVESLAAVIHLLPHMIDLLHGKTGHDRPSTAGAR